MPRNMLISSRNTSQIGIAVDGDRDSKLSCPALVTVTITSDGPGLALTDKHGALATLFEKAKIC